MIRTNLAIFDLLFYGVCMCSSKSCVLCLVNKTLRMVQENFVLYQLASIFPLAVAVF